MQTLSSLLWLNDFPNVKKKKALEMFKDKYFCIEKLEEKEFPCMCSCRSNFIDSIE